MTAWATLNPVEQAIRSAVRASACRDAARIDERSAHIWLAVADAETRRGKAALLTLVRRLPQGEDEW